MARIARVVVPDIFHHITQRGNRRMDTFFSESDYSKDLSLMPNHVHLTAVPESEDGLYRSRFEKSTIRVLKKQRLSPQKGIKYRFSGVLGFLRKLPPHFASKLP